MNVKKNIIVYQGASFPIVVRSESISIDSDNSQQIKALQPYMAASDEVSKISADALYQEFGITMDGFMMEVNFEGLSWEIWIRPIEDEKLADSDFASQEMPKFYLNVNATTREVSHLQRIE